MAKIGKEVLTRLRRVFDDGDEPPALLAQAIVETYADCLGPQHVLLLERWMTCVATAAEQLGQDADPKDILTLAHEIESRLS